MHCRKSHTILRDKLTQALQSVEESRRGTARHGDTPLADVERIGLRPERRIDPEYDAAFGNSGNFQPKSMFPANIPHEEFRDTPQRFSPAGVQRSAIRRRAPLLRQLRKRCAEAWER